MRILWGLVPAMIITWSFKERLMEVLVHPLTIAWRHLGLGAPQLHFANPVDPFVAYLQISMVGAVLLCSPWIFWQLWAFVAPGLYRREKRLAIPFVLASTLCFAGGSLFGYLVVFPLGFETLLSFAGMLPNQSLRLQPTLMIHEYLGFALRMLLAFGVVFEVPVVITFLAAIGMVNWRQLLRFSRWWVLIASIIAAVLTPPDVGSQLLMLGPLVALYFVGIGFAALVGKAPDKP